VEEGILWCAHCTKPHRIGTAVCPETGRSIDRALNRAQRRDDPLLGTVLADRYVIRRLIGNGASAAVYEAENTVLKRLVAIKVVKNEASAAAIERLYREARLVATVYHPNICDLHDFGTTPSGAPFLVLERLFGETFARFLGRYAPTPANVARELFVQLLSGLHSAHGAQIVHRDLKPQNIFLVDRAGCVPLVKIVDFGLARDLSKLQAGSPLTQPGKAVGTPKYMAPEQLFGEGVGPRSDLFSVGVMLYEALAGKHPFEGDSVVEVKSNILQLEPTPISQLRPRLPADSDAFFARALAKDPKARFSSALEMQADLVRVLV